MTSMRPHPNITSGEGHLCRSAADMRPRMEPDEIALFTRLACVSRVYLEFGSGGSTLLASQLVSEAVISTDSSEAWLSQVASECERAGTPIRPALLFAK